MTSRVSNNSTYNNHARRERADSTSTDDSVSIRAQKAVNSDEYDDDPRIKVNRGPRKIFIQKSETGFGFNVRGQVSEGGPLKLFNGEFYAPLQQVSAVLAGGAAERAGLNRGDKILDVNGINVDGSTHKQVVDLIKSGGDYLTLIVLSMPSDEINRVMNDNNSDDSSTNSNDYSDRQVVPVKIRDYLEVKNAQNDKYVVFNIYLGPKHLVSKRYKEFDMFHLLLKREFSDFTFPSFPKKWPFRLSDSQLESRRKALEFYLESVCSVKVIFDTDIVKDFLDLPENHMQLLEHPNNDIKPTKISRDNDDILQNGTSISYDILPSTKEKPIISKEVNMQINLPDMSKVSLKISPNMNTDEVYKKLVVSIQLDPQIKKYFYLYEIIDESFERKLRPTEMPYKINVQNYTKKNSSTSICMKKWYFNPRVEILLAKNSQTLKYLFTQAVEDFNRNQMVLPENSDVDLKFLQENHRYLDYLKKVAKLDGYGELAFPHCACSSRKSGHVIVVLSSNSFKLKACTREGHLETQVVEFSYEDVERIDVDDDEMTFLIEVKISNRPNRIIKISTGFYLYMYDCVEKILEDHRGDE